MHIQPPTCIQYNEDNINIAWHLQIVWCQAARGADGTKREREREREKMGGGRVKERDKQ